MNQPAKSNPQPSSAPRSTSESANEKSFQISAPSISLPKGGGAIRGMGEKFAANPVTGTGSMTVPIATSPGRSGFGPQLSLSYDSGAGNGPFGLGWNLALPSITRKTDKVLRRYRDADEFILSGAEDLVSEFEKDLAGNWVLRDGEHVIHDKPRTVDDVAYSVRRYRPRIESLFARIERWTNQKTGELHWRSISRDNITTLYGNTNESRIFDPAGSNPEHPTRVFSWLICQSYDDKGNAIDYEYHREDSERIFEDQQGQFVELAHDGNRFEVTRSANCYLKRIKYGNRTPNRDTTTWQTTDPAQLPDDTWMFELVFDYGEGRYTEQAPDDQGQIFGRAQINHQAGSHWPVRKDPFSTYRAGFEVRTSRLCRRVLMFHHFPQELGINDCVVRATEFSYPESPIASFITSVIQSGFVRQPTQNEPNRYRKKSIPPLEFEYSKATIQEKLEEIDAESLENLPQGLDGTQYRWADLDRKGAGGILTEQGGAWFYKRNFSPLPIEDENGQLRQSVRFAPAISRTEDSLPNENFAISTFQKRPGRRRGTNFCCTSRTNISNRR